MIGFYVDGFYFYFDEWVLILLMVDEWGLLMVDEWWLGFSSFSSFVVNGFVGFFVSMLMVDLCGGFWLIWIFGNGCGWSWLANCYRVVVLGWQCLWIVPFVVFF